MTLTVGQEVRLKTKPGIRRGRYEIRALEQDKHDKLLITVYGPLRINGHAGYHYIRACDIVVK